MPAILPDGVTWDQFNEMKDYLCQWRFGSITGQTEVQAAQVFKEKGTNNVNLFNKESNCFLQWEKQSLGINLGWTDHGDSATAAKVTRWIVRPADGSTGPIRYGEEVALGYGTEPSFYRYASRTVGINLENVKAPYFEWRIIGGEVGQPVRAGNMVAIFNTRVEREGIRGDFFVRHYRTAGGNIGWTSSPDGDYVKKYAKKYGPAVALAVIKGLLG